MRQSGLINRRQMFRLVWNQYRFYIIMAVLGIVAFTVFSTVTIMHFTTNGK